MTSANGRGEARRRGSIRERGGSLQVRVYAGQDPVTGKDRYLSRTIKGTDRAARKRAEKAMTQLQADVDKQRVPGDLRSHGARAGRVVAHGGDGADDAKDVRRVHRPHD